MTDEQKPEDRVDEASRRRGGSTRRERRRGTGISAGSPFGPLILTATARLTFSPSASPARGTRRDRDRCSSLCSRWHWPFSRLARLLLIAPMRGISSSQLA
jgi:hypothetical protein